MHSVNVNIFANHGLWGVSPQSCMTLCDPVDYSLPGFLVHRILQTRVLEWIVLSSSRASLQPRGWTQASCTGRQVLYCWAMGKAPSSISRAPEMLPTRAEANVVAVRGGQSVSESLSPPKCYLQALLTTCHLLSYSVICEHCRKWLLSKLLSTKLIHIN